MEDTFKKIRKEFLDAVESVKDDKALKELRTKYFGRKGVVTTALRQVKELTESERPRVGKLANEIKGELEDVFKQAKSRIGGSGGDAVSFDPTQPATKTEIGRLHPITQIQRQVEHICQQMGFAILDGPEVESEYFNFTALNIPEDHPARDMQDTFWLTDGNLLRTHTSPVQVRALRKYGVPFRGIVPGRVYRYEATDASHDHTFYQVEGLLVDKNVSVAHMIGVMQAMLQQLFESSVEVRLRPAYYPFVEPGFDLDFKCLICRGKGCSVCKKVGWIEMMGCGLVHPDVLKAGNVDPEVYSGFAFGLGLTRLAMMNYGINDIRLLTSGDLRFSKQF